MARVPVYSRHKRTEPPCKGCEERKVGCHSVCDGYKKWQEYESAKRIEAHRLHRSEAEARDYVVTRIRTMKAKKGRS